MKMSDLPRVAIVGVGGLFPNAADPARLWDLVSTGADMAREAPAGRWLLSPEEVFDPTAGKVDRVYSRRGCFLDPFQTDCEGLDLTPALVSELDPLFHLVLRAGKDAFESGVTTNLDRRRVGVILGNIALPTEKASALARHYLGRTFAEQLDQPFQDNEGLPHPWNSHVPALPAGVLAKALGLGGGSFTLDAACASSLYAIKLAVDELQSGRADAMLAGGVSRPDCLYTQMGFSQLRALSPSGRCSPFDAKADGLVVGEGAGIFFLKRLEDAERDGDKVWAVIAGIGLSNDLGGGLLAPNSEGQLRAMREAYRQAGWTPSDVDLIECHATGTPVGDAVEFASLQKLWEGSSGKCVLGSVKSTVGHLLTAAGAAAVTKVLFALKHEALPPTANFERPAPGVAVAGSPFRILSRVEPWPRRGPGVPRRAAISAFGFGGINAHLLLEEAIPNGSGCYSRKESGSENAVAVIGMEASFGPWNNLQELRERVLGGVLSFEPQSPSRWWGVEKADWFRGKHAPLGYYLKEVAVDSGKFRIPPRELEEMLPQQLLMLRVAAGAIERAGGLPEGRRLRTGVFIGLGLDHNTTNFHFRWWVIKQAKEWIAGVPEGQLWARNLPDAAGPPLTANRTMGALGSIIASRIAREFHLGGPSYAISSEESSGLRALQVAVEALASGELDLAVVGAVDLAGDVRAVLASGVPERIIGEGAAAVVLKRLADAERDGDRVLAVIREIKAAGGETESPSAECEPEIGHAGAASGMADLVRACLLMEKKTGRVEICSLGMDGNCLRVVLDGRDIEPARPAAKEAGPIRRLAVPVGGAPFEVAPIPKIAHWGETPANPIPATVATLEARSKAHAAFLRLSQSVQETMAGSLAFQGQLLERSARRRETIEPTPSPIAMDRAACLDFAIGSVARVLGPAFAEVDFFPTRVRLPDEPLMLVDRILKIEGEARSLSHGRVITEHDVRPDGWYLDNGRMATCVAVEAGQADLFLSAYLGIDFQTRGLAVYRLLDAAVTFHRGLPGPGKVIRYDIHIDRFFRQGDTYLFRFRFEGTVDGEPFLTMTEGCAGFFRAEELASGKGVVHTTMDRRPGTGKRPDGEAYLPPMEVEAFDEGQVERLRKGDLAGCFGALFRDLPLRNPPRLPGGHLKLVDRVMHVDPHGGRFGVGSIRAEADIHPNDWFLTCHFVDDQVMPGTLMYECCLHTLRIFLLRLGWVGEHEEMVCEPMPGVKSRLKCRGQVTATTRTVTYEVTLKERGYRPEPFAIVDALMFADGKPIVEITDMSIQLTGLSRESIAAIWKKASGGRKPPEYGAIRSQGANAPRSPGSPRYGPASIRAFAVGKPSKAFGEPYRIFDENRIIARLPGPPYQFLDRILQVEGEPWVMAAGAAAEAEYDVPGDEWYFAAERAPRMPFSVLLEVALQPCGWLAAYVGSALTSDEDLCFRNLGGEAEAFGVVGPDAGTLTTKVRLSRVAKSAGMIIQDFEFSVRNGPAIVYQGSTTFGFFTRKALAQQVGVRDAKRYEPAQGEPIACRRVEFPPERPFPDTMLRMLDKVEMLSLDGGPNHLGFAEGKKIVRPEEWFFKAHFFQDPVCPGSLGLESLLQLLKLLAAEKWGAKSSSQFEANLGGKHRWIYRGQVIPTNKEVTVQAFIKSREEGTRPLLTADGLLLVDGLPIYQMNDFTIRLIP
jgi:3-oxoacyl-(acyl-carrier-protein) synthase/3-hydroxymyristoyl/3-hydroxydecanoyl-(acyl carrier protein) dehydratase